MRSVGDVRAATQDREDGPQTLCSRLRDTVNVEAALSRGSEVRRAMYVDVEIKGAACTIPRPHLASSIVLQPQRPARGYIAVQRT